MKSENPKGYTVKEAAALVNTTFFLPDIQREYRWGEDRVIALFDSIWQNYPLGTLMVWKQKVDHYDSSQHFLYKFVNEAKANENTGKRLDKPAKTNHGITKQAYLQAVLDGQQRLTAIYIALYGGYRAWKGSGRHKTGEEPPLRELYFAPKLVKNGDSTNAFAFFDKAPQNTINWYKIKDIIATKADRYCTKNRITGHEKSRILDLYNKLTEEKRIYVYWMSPNFSVDDVVNIFIRMNSGGVPLRKTELLFALAINSWPSGRETIESFINSIHNNTKKFGEWPSIDKDFILKACLYLINEDTSLSVSKMQDVDFTRIESEWNDICESISDVLAFLDENGHSSLTIESANAILPIIYYRKLNPTHFKNAKVKKHLNTMFIVTQIAKVFGSSTDNVLSNIRLVMEANFKSKDFNYSQFANEYGKMVGNVDVIKCDRKTIRAWVSGNKTMNPLKKGDDTKLILASLPEYRERGNYYYEQDHLHPASSFTNENKISELKMLGFTQAEIEEMNELKDTLGNLQLYRDINNQKKNNKSLENWMKENPSWTFKYDPSNGISKMACFGEHDDPYDIKFFRDFVGKRGNKISDALEGLLIE